MLSLTIISSPGGTMQKFLLVAISILFMLPACSAQADSDQIATIVAATLQAGSPTQGPTATSGNPETLTGTVEGSICYPAEGIPPMTLYLQPSGGGDAVALPISQNQS